MKNEKFDSLILGRWPSVCLQEYEVWFTMNEIQLSSMMNLFGTFNRVRPLDEVKCK